MIRASLNFNSDGLVRLAERNDYVRMRTVYFKS